MPQASFAFITLKTKQSKKPLVQRVHGSFQNLRRSQSQTAPEELISYYDHCFEVLFKFSLKLSYWMAGFITKTSSSDLNIHDIFTYSDKSHNSVSLVCLILAKVLYWGNLLSLVQKLLCQEKYVGFKEWNKYIFFTLTRFSLWC